MSDELLISAIKAQDHAVKLSEEALSFQNNTQKLVMLQLASLHMQRAMLSMLMFLCRIQVRH